MNERPILFSAPMIRALLDGTKTQTRRVVKWIPGARGEGKLVRLPRTNSAIYLDDEHGLRWSPYSGSGEQAWPVERIGEVCPYGGPGDQLWVRETWYCDDHTVGDLARARVGYVGAPPSDEALIARWREALDFRATHDCSAWEAGCPCRDDDGRSCWRPSIFMPRWASRISLELAKVRVERLHAITDADAWAEGIEAVDGELDASAICRAAHFMACSHEDARATYGALWAEINGEQSLIDNPWVWVVEFKLLEAAETAA